MSAGARQLLEDLGRRGVKVWTSEAGDNLRYKGPKKALTPDVLAELEAQKGEVLEDLELMRTGRIQSERQVFRIAREHFGLDGKDSAA